MLVRNNDHGGVIVVHTVLSPVLDQNLELVGRLYAQRFPDTEALFRFSFDGRQECAQRIGNQQKRFHGLFRKIPFTCYDHHFSLAWLVRVGIKVVRIIVKVVHRGEDLLDMVDLQFHKAAVPEDIEGQLAFGS